jgi:hypothetical protein
MSYTIEYQATCFILPAGLRGLTKTKFLIASESGSNNLTRRTADGRERRSREWGIAMLGSLDEVVQQAVRIAACCEQGDLKVGGRWTSPEAYIARTRRLLTQARDDVVSHLTLHATVRANHPLVARARLFGLAEERQRRFGKDEAVLSPPKNDDGPDWGVFFRTVAPFISDRSISPYRLGAVWGLPPS